MSSLNVRPAAAHSRVKNRRCADCQNDSHCVDTRCAPYADGEANQACARVVPAGLLSPSIFCEWLGPPAGDPHPTNVQVLSTPLVADFNFDGHRSSEFPTIHPSIVVNSYNNGSDGSCGLGPDNDRTAWGILRILDGQGWSVAFCPDDGRATSGEIAALGALGCEVLCKPEITNLPDWLRRHGAQRPLRRDFWRRGLRACLRVPAHEGLQQKRRDDAEQESEGE